MGLISVSNPYFLKAQQHKEMQYIDPSKLFSVSVYGEYVSSAELFDNINSPDVFLRDLSVEMTGGYGYGGEITYSPNIYNLGVSFYLSSEYLKVKDDGLMATDVLNDTTIIRGRFTEEFSVVPVEAGLKWTLPFGGDFFRFYIGGGAGMYFGSRTRTIAGVSSVPVNSTPGFSLNILTGAEYYFGRNLSLDFAFKFRDGSFETEDKFMSPVPVFGTELHSRINVDGVRLSVGIRYNF